MDLAIVNFFESLHDYAFWNYAAIFLARYLPYLIVLGAIFFVLKFKNFRERFRAFVYLALTVILARGVIFEIIRFFHSRRRPFDVLDFSPLIPSSGNAFPSGHATFFFALAIALWFINRRLGYWALAAAALNSLARVYAGVHWPTDILGGILVAFLAFYLIHLALKNILIKENPPLVQNKQ